MADYRYIANIQGPGGGRGPVGPTPELGIGTVRQVTAEMGADAQIDGTPEQPRLSLDIPAGLPGPDVAPTDEAVGAMIQTYGTSSNQATQIIADQRVAQATAGHVEGAGVRRVVANRDVETELSTGDLLVALETPTFFTDFSSNEVDRPPYDWTPRIVAHDPIVVEDQSASKGRLLRVQGSGEARRLLSWDTLTDTASEYGDVEVVVKWRASDRFVSTRGFSHGAGSTPGDVYAYFGGRLSSRRADVVGSYASGDDYISDAGREPYTWNAEPDEWWCTRYRIAEESHIWARSWRWGTPEPEEWVWANILSTYPRGWVGLITWGRTNTWTMEYDWVGVSFDGGRAPMGG